MRRRDALVACSALPLLAASTQAAPRDAQATLDLARCVLPGDLVFRAGTSPESMAVLSVSSHALSHVGVAARRPGTVAVIHASPPDRRSDGGVVVSTWEEFGLADDVEAVRVYRLRDLRAGEQAHIVAAAVSMLGRPFDNRFRLSSDDGSIYCTLLALRACGRADPAIFTAVRPRRVPLFDDPVYLPESLLAWPRLAPIEPTQAREESHVGQPVKCTSSMRL